MSRRCNDEEYMGVAGKGGWRGFKLKASGIFGLCLLLGLVSLLKKLWRIV